VAVAVEDVGRLRRGNIYGPPALEVAADRLVQDDDVEVVRKNVSDVGQVEAVADLSAG